MTTLTDTQVITASGGLVELGYQSTDRTNVAVSATTSSGATELVSTTVVCDGGPILIEFQCCIACATGEGVAFRVWIDGVDTAGFAGNTNSQTNRETYFQTVRLQPAAGSRTISIRWYRWTGSTVLTSLTGNAILRVSKIVQATQWPAVTTGTIICTSSTRPSAPFEGQTIYETDTDLSLTWSGSAWVQTGALSAWTSYTPTFTGYGGLTITQGNSSVEGKYTRVGRTIHFRARWFFGSTTSFSANGYFMGGLPVTAASSWNPGITAAILDSGSSHYVAMPMMADASTTTFAIGGTYTGGTYASQAAPTAMFVWNSGDAVYWGGTYEAAA